MYGRKGGAEWRRYLALRLCSPQCSQGRLAPVTLREAAIHSFLCSLFSRSPVKVERCPVLEMVPLAVAFSLQVEGGPGLWQLGGGG